MNSHSIDKIIVDIYINTDGNLDHYKEESVVW